MGPLVTQTFQSKETGKQSTADISHENQRGFTFKTLHKIALFFKRKEMYFVFFPLSDPITIFYKKHAHYSKIIN